MGVGLHSMADGNSTSVFLAWWGAGLSTTLALLKLFELWQTRFRLEVSYNFTGSVEIGNEVLIRNLSAKPVILTHWELFYRSGWFKHKDEPIKAAEHDSGDRQIAPHSTFTLHFSEATYFDWGHGALKNRKIYVRLHLAGRRSQCRLVYPQ